MTVAYLAKLEDCMMLALGAQQAPSSPPVLLTKGDGNNPPTISYLDLNLSFSPLSLWRE